MQILKLSTLAYRFITTQQSHLHIDLDVDSGVFPYILKRRKRVFTKNKHQLNKKQTSFHILFVLIRLCY